MGNWTTWQGLVRLNEHAAHRGTWCPACQAMHVFDERWAFDGNFEAPTFTPSMSSKYGCFVEGAPRRPDGKCDICERHKANGTRTPCCICHFNVTKGQIIFHADCTHGWGGRTVALTRPPEGAEA